MFVGEKNYIMRYNYVLAILSLQEIGRILTVASVSAKRILPSMYSKLVIDVKPMTLNMEI